MTSKADETNSQWPPDEYEKELAQIGRIILHFNSLENGTKGVLRQFIISDFSDRIVLGLCESLNGVELEKNLLRFAHVQEHEGGSAGCEDTIRHLIKVFQNGKSLRNRIVHELANYLYKGRLFIRKHTFSPNHQGRALLLDYDLLTKIVEWLSSGSQYAAEVGIELSFARGLRSPAERLHIPNNKAGWPEPIDLLTWDKLEVK